jgi:hypothetical protein
MDQSILDGLPEGYTLVKVGNSTDWIHKSLGLITHKLEVPCLELPLQVRAVAKV